MRLPPVAARTLLDRRLTSLIPVEHDPALPYRLPDIQLPALESDVALLVEADRAQHRVELVLP